MCLKFSELGRGGFLWLDTGSGAVTCAGAKKTDKHEACQVVSNTLGGVSCRLQTRGLAQVTARVRKTRDHEALSGMKTSAVVRGGTETCYLPAVNGDALSSSVVLTQSIFVFAGICFRYLTVSGVLHQVPDRVPGEEFSEYLAMHFWAVSCYVALLILPGSTRTALRIAQFRRRPFSIAQRATPKLFADMVDRYTLELQIGSPNPIKNFFVTFANVQRCLSRTTRRSSTGCVDGFRRFSRVRGSPGTTPPRCVLIKWLCRVSVGLKIHAESSSNGSSQPASHKSSTLSSHHVASSTLRAHHIPVRAIRRFLTACP